MRNTLAEIARLAECIVERIYGTAGRRDVPPIPESNDLWQRGQSVLEDWDRRFESEYGKHWPLVELLDTFALLHGTSEDSGRLRSDSDGNLLVLPRRHADHARVVVAFTDRIASFEDAYLRGASTALPREADRGHIVAVVRDHVLVESATMDLADAVVSIFCDCGVLRRIGKQIALPGEPGGAARYPADVGLKIWQRGASTLEFATKSEAFEVLALLIRGPRDWETWRDSDRPCEDRSVAVTWVSDPVELLRRIEWERELRIAAFGDRCRDAATTIVDFAIAMLREAAGEDHRRASMPRASSSATEEKPVTRPDPQEQTGVIELDLFDLEEVVARKGGYTATIRGRSQVMLLRLVAKAPHYDHSWFEIHNAWLKEINAGEVSDWRPPPKIESLKRYGSRVRKILGELGCYWHQDGSGVRWAPPESS